MTSQPVLEARGVHLKFPIYSAESRSFRNALTKMALGSRIGVDSAGKSSVDALHGINFRLNGGDRVGLIGPNGAGKTSLLKLLAGIYAPTQGVVERRGIVTTLFSISLGLDPNATGLENIYLANYLRGLPKAHIEARIEDIIDFAEINEFIHMPVRTYSSGMRTRLAFSIATAFVPDILLVDEVFGMGDANFLKKSRERMQDLMSSAKVFVLASHNDKIIEEFCNKAILLRRGRQVAMGGVEEILELHRQNS